MQTGKDQKTRQTSKISKLIKENFAALLHNIIRLTLMQLQAQNRNGKLFNTAGIITTKY